MNTDLSSFKHLLTDYTELRCQENNSLVIGFLQGDNTTNTRLTTGGVSARVYKKGSWGFASYPEISTEGVRFAITTATRNASFLAVKEPRPDYPLPHGIVTSHRDEPKPSSRLHPERLVWLF